MDMPTEPNPDTQTKTEKENAIANLVIEYFNNFCRSEERFNFALNITKASNEKPFPLRFEVREIFYPMFLIEYAELVKNISGNSILGVNDEFPILKSSTSKHHNYKIIFTVDLKWVTELPPFSF